MTNDVILSVLMGYTVGLLIGCIVGQVGLLWVRYLIRWQPWRAPIQRFRQWLRWRKWRKEDSPERRAAVQENLDFVAREMNRTEPLTEEEQASRPRIDFNTAWGGILADSPANIDLFEDSGTGPSGEYIPSLNERITQARKRYGVRKNRDSAFVDEQLQQLHSWSLNDNDKGEVEKGKP